MDIPGQPWNRANGTASRFSEKSAMKWTLNSSPSSSLIGIVKLGNELMCFSQRLLFGRRQRLLRQIGRNIHQVWAGVSRENNEEHHRRR